MRQGRKRRQDWSVENLLAIIIGSKKVSGRKRCQAEGGKGVRMIYLGEETGMRVLFNVSPRPPDSVRDPDSISIEIGKSLLE